MIKECMKELQAYIHRLETQKPARNNEIELLLPLTLVCRSSL